MSFIIRNISAGGVVIDDLGIDLPNPGDEHDLRQEPPNDVAISSDLPAHITAGNIAVLDPLDGSTILSISDALELIAATNDPHFRIRGGRKSEIQDFVEGDYVHIVGTETITGSKTFTADTKIGGSLASVYTLSVQKPTANNAWLEILNNGGTNQGVFFGIQNNDFELWNYQGGDILFYTNPSASNGTVRYTITNSGDHIFNSLASAGTGVASISPSGQLIKGASLDNLNNVTAPTPVADDVLYFDGTSWINSPASTLGGGNFVLEWKFSTNTTASDPGNGKIKYDNSDPGLVTNLYINDKTNGGVDVSALLAKLSINDEIYIQQTKDAGRAGLFKVSATPTDNTGWWTVPVIVEDSTGTLPQNNKTVAVVIFFVASVGFQNLWETITGDTGSATASTPTDTITIAGGLGVTTSVSGTTLTITNDAPNVDQNIWETFNADGGTATATSPTDTITIAGGTGVTTSITGTTLTIDASGEANTASNLGAGDGVFAQKNGVDLEFKSLTAGSGIQLNPTATEIQIVNTSPNVDQNLFDSFSDGANIAIADSTTDTFSFIAGAGIGVVVDPVADSLTITNTAPNVDQNLWLTITSDSGSTSANTTTDDLFIIGGTGISTSIIGDTLTIVNDAPNVAQNLWETITSDNGSTTANTTTDTLNVVGGTGISTSIVGDVLTIVNNSPNVDQNLFESFSDGTNTAVADTTTDTFTFNAGTGITAVINPANDSITITNTAPNVDQNLWETIAADTGSSTAGTPTDTITVTGTGGITTSITGSTLTVDGSGISATPGGVDTNVQYNNGGVFGGENNFIYDDVNKRIEVSGPAATTRAVYHIGTDTLDLTQIDNSAVYVQVDGNAAYEGLRIYFNRTTAGTNGWIAYDYDGRTPNLRLIDEDDDPAYVSFRTIGTGTFNSPQFENAFGTRGPTAGATNGFSWWVGGNSGNGGTEIMSVDSNFLRLPSDTTANRPTPATNGMIRYNTTTNRFEGYENGAWVDLVQRYSHLFRHNGTTTQTYGTTAITVNYGTNVRTDADYTHAIVAGGSEITINRAGWYSISTDVSSNNTTNTREDVEIVVQLNGTNISGARGYSYHRNAADGRNTATVMIKQQLAVNDVIRVRVRSVTAGTLTTLANGCQLNIESIDSP